MDPSAIGAILATLRSKGETPEEIAGMVRAMKKACNTVQVDGKCLDIVGTGGDGEWTTNHATFLSFELTSLHTYENVYFCNLITSRGRYDQY